MSPDDPAPASLIDHCIRTLIEARQKRLTDPSNPHGGETFTEADIAANVGDILAALRVPAKEQAQ